MKPVAYMIWAPFTGPAQFTTDPRAPEMTARRADYTCTPLVTERDALAAIEQARREAFEEAAKVVEHSGGFDTHVRAQLAAAIRARGEGKCPDCGRVKARSADDCAAGACAKWYAVRDAEARNECLAIRARGSKGLANPKDLDTATRKLTT